MHWTYILVHTLNKCPKSNLAKGRIAVLSPLAVANASVRRVHWAGTFANDGRRTMQRAGTYRASKAPLPAWDLDPYLMYGLDPHESAQAESRSVQLYFCTVHQFAQQTHIQTHRSRHSRVTCVAIGRIYALRTGDAA